MNAEDFIAQLTKETGIDASQAQNVSGIFESTFLSGNKNKDTITKLISEKLGVDDAKADMIYNAAVGILSSGVLDKVTGLFK